MTYKNRIKNQIQYYKDHRDEINVSIVIAGASMYVGYRISQTALARSPNLYLEITPTLADRLHETGGIVGFETSLGNFAVANICPNRTV